MVLQVVRLCFSGVIDNQYGEGTGIAQYDFQIVLEEGQANYNDSKIVADINAVEHLESSMLGYLKVCKGYSDETDKEMEIELSMDTGDILDEFLSLLEWDVDGLELLEYFSDVSYMWEVWQKIIT